MPRITQTEAEEMFDIYAARGEYDFIVCLVEEGYDVTTSNAYFHAAWAGYLNILEFLDEVSRYRHPLDALYAAESNGHVGVVRHIKKTYAIK